MRLFRTKETYLEYSTNIEEKFSALVDKPRFFERDDGFCGEMHGNQFWFYKRYPLQRNSFRTVLYGEIVDDHTIKYSYGKFI